MAETTRSTDTPDWLFPVLLIAGAIIAGLVGFGIWTATQDDPAEDSSLIRQLELYTSCLNDNGANVPLVETRSDGGFTVTVPGSLLDHDTDLERWELARDQCRALEPNPAEVLFGGEGIDLLVPWLFDARWDRLGSHCTSRGPGLEEMCERIQHRDLSDDVDA